VTRPGESDTARVIPVARNPELAKMGMLEEVFAEDV
jgi:hypothetical protein